MLRDSNITDIKILSIQAGMADPAPPLGTILGNLGVNTVTFCNNFNTYTKDLPSYFLIVVKIFIHVNRSVTFTTSMPTTGFFLKMLKFDRVINVRIYDRNHEKTIQCIKLISAVKLALFKFPYLELRKSFPIILGTIKSMGVVVVK